MGATNKKLTQNNSNRTVSHPLYGEIPFIEVVTCLPNGERAAQSWWKPDPDFQPHLPTGAIRGEVHKQDFCAWCHLPKYFYVDIEKTCLQCGNRFIFSAGEQKYWYETLKFNFSSTAVRCKNCRHQRRSERALKQQLSEASQIVNENPDDPLALIELTKVTVAYFLRFGEGHLEPAIATIRKAFRLDATRYECMFWEARCQELLGRTPKAKILYQQFVERAGQTRKYRPLLKEASERSTEL